MESINHEQPAEEQELQAGSFSSWLRRTRSALIKENGTEVPCGTCNACCRSSYFIHIRPEESGTLASINRKLLFPAPGLPKGNVLMGYGKNGSCPMLVDNKCSIYETRSITCRSYDCRIFAAAGLSSGAEDKALINRQIKRWRFDYPAKRDRDQHLAVQNAAKFLIEHADCFPGGTVPQNPLQIAILAIKVYGVFLRYSRKTANPGSGIPAAKTAREIMAANARFEAKYDRYKASMASNIFSTSK